MGLVALAIVTTVAADVAPLPAPLPAPAQPLTPKKRHLPRREKYPSIFRKNHMNMRQISGDSLEGRSSPRNLAQKRGRGSTLKRILEGRSGILER